MATFEIKISNNLYNYINSNDDLNANISERKEL